MNIELLVRSMVCEMYAVEHSMMRVDTSNTDQSGVLVIFIDTDNKFRQRKVKGECVDWNKHVCRRIKRMMSELLPFFEIKVYGRYTENFPKTAEDALNLYGYGGFELIQMMSTIERLQSKTPSREYTKEESV